MVLDAGIEYEFFEPVGAGDVLTFSAKIAEMTEKESKSGAMLITTIESTYINQNGDLAARARASVINR